MIVQLKDLATGQLGVFTRGQALAAGVSEDEARRSIDRGEWSRVRRGAYTTPEIWAAADEARRQVLRLQAAALQLDPPVIGSHDTAAAAHAIEVWDPSYDWIHVTRPDRSARREGGVWHHLAALPPTHVSTVDGLSVTSLLRTGFDLARYAADAEHALVAVDSTLRAVGGDYADRVNALGELRELYTERIDWPGARQAGGAVSGADPRSGSVGESRARIRFGELGFAPPLTQVCVHDELGVLVGIADFAFVAEKTLAEFDGRIKYGLDGVTQDAMAGRLWAEKLREDALRRLGWEIVRIVWADLYAPGRIRTRLCEAFLRGQRTGPVRGSFSLAVG